MEGPAYTLNTDEIETRFTFHPPKGDEQIDKYQTIRRQAKEYAELISKMCPDSREKSLALTKLEECVMWANAAIARRE
jgi:hypothetical protein